MKIIFLDIDGVLNNMGTMFKRIKYDGFTGIDPVNVEPFNRLMSQTDAKIVISSSWRLGRTADEMASILAEHHVLGEVIGRTKYLDSGVRGMEILQWLIEHGPVESFAIIDDSSDMAHLMPHLVHTTHMCGFSEIHIPKVLEMLQKPAFPYKAAG